MIDCNVYLLRFVHPCMRVKFARSTAPARFPQDSMPRTRAGEPAGFFVSIAPSGSAGRAWGFLPETLSGTPRAIGRARNVPTPDVRSSRGILLRLPCLGMG